MEDGRIADNQITASDHYTYTVNENFVPAKARLHVGYLCWATHIRDTNQWIQITFSRAQFIYGVVTQGYRNTWVTSYNVEYSEDGEFWQYIMTAVEQEKVLYIFFLYQQLMLTLKKLLYCSAVASS